MPDADDRVAVHRIIDDERCAGIVRETSRAVYQRVIAGLAARGAQVVVLGCTEITLLIQPADSALPTLGSTLLHARAAVDFGLADEPPAPLTPAGCSWP